MAGSKSSTSFDFYQSYPQKSERLTEFGETVNSKHAEVRTKSNLDNKLNKLFDVSACTCWLENVSCNDVQVCCKLVGCQQRHILCFCPTYLKVPLEERAYLGDQRLKTGPKGSFQMASVDRAELKGYQLPNKVLTHHLCRNFQTKISGAYLGGGALCHGSLPYDSAF